MTTELGSSTASLGGKEPVAFIIPVRNPRDKKVHDYGVIEALLRSTVSSILKQSHSEVHVVVVGHQAPRWADEVESRVHFIDVSHDDVFAPDQNPVKIDKGLRYVIGTLYALHRLRPTLIMLLDADDYVNVKLAEYVLELRHRSPDVDCYMINRGVHAGVSVDSKYNVCVRFAIEVDEFDFTCGSCRIFEAESLRAKLRQIDASIEDRFEEWGPSDATHCIPVGDERLLWFVRATSPCWDERDHLINVLGRHTRQKAAFRVQYVDLVGAAKGCGHGNHDGPRQGAVHWHRATRNVPLTEFLSDFGLPPQRWSAAAWARFRARTADKQAGRLWTDKYARKQ